MLEQTIQCNRRTFIRIFLSFMLVRIECCEVEVNNFIVKKCEEKRDGILLRFIWVSYFRKTPNALMLFTKKFHYTRHFLLLWTVDDFSHYFFTKPFLLHWFFECFNEKYEAEYLMKNLIHFPYNPQTFFIMNNTYMPSYLTFENWNQIYMKNVRYCYR